MSLYDRLNLTKAAHPLNTPIWERINLTRPPKLRCQGCRSRLQTDWRVCPHCGWSIKSNTSATKSEMRHCVWVDISGMVMVISNNNMMQEVIIDALAKVFSAFRGVSVFLTSEPPEPKQWGQNFTHVYVFVDSAPVNYLGVASFQTATVTNVAGVRIDQILAVARRDGLTWLHISNLIANTVVHEIGHTLGLDHSELTTDVMHDGLDHGIHSLMPPAFHAEQIMLMNHAITKYKKIW